MSLKFQIVETRASKNKKEIVRVSLRKDPSDLSTIELVVNDVPILRLYSDGSSGRPMTLFYSQQNKFPLMLNSSGQIDCV